MRIPKTVYAAASLAAVAVGVFAFQNCSHSSGSGGSSGPIDGKYNVTSYTCGNTSILSYYASRGITAVTFSVSNTSATETITVSTGCQASQALTLTYVDSSHLTSVQGATSCSATCGQTCTPTPAPINQTPTVMGFILSSNVLTLTGTVETTDMVASSDIYQAGCQLGALIQMSMVHQ